MPPSPTVFSIIHFLSQTTFFVSLEVKFHLCGSWIYAGDNTDPDMLRKKADLSFAPRLSTTALKQCPSLHNS